jgi:SAM-dependent methyltransferase
VSHDLSHSPIADDSSASFPRIHWEEAGAAQTARWRSENGTAAPKRVVIADDRTTADDAYHLACAGTALLWRGDFQNARQMLQAMTRRLERTPRRKSGTAAKQAKARDMTPAEAFHQHRLTQSQRARTLSMLLLPLGSDYSVPLRRAPDIQQACLEAYGTEEADGSVVSLRELLGLIGAHEWRKKGVALPALGERIHPHYGVFAPIRSEYVGLVAEAPLPSRERAFDIGTGTGVLAVLLAQRGVAQIIATDLNPRALACAQDNVSRLGFSDQIEIIHANLFPEGRAPLVVCNPPWLPARPSSALEHAVYDPDSQMLRGFIAGLAAHLTPEGEGWLLLSDLAEHLGLRSRTALLAMFDAAGLKIIDRLEVAAHHPRASDETDVLHAARAAEITSLWRLAAIKPEGLSHRSG